MVKMPKADIAQYKTYEEIKNRLDVIEKEVKSKDISLERSLDLFDEAIALSSKAVDLVDKTNFSEQESKQIDNSADEAKASKE